MATLIHVLAQALDLPELSQNLKPFACAIDFPDEKDAVLFFKTEITQSLQIPAQSYQLKRSASCLQMQNSLIDTNCDDNFRLNLAIFGSVQKYYRVHAVSAPDAIRRFEINDIEEAVCILNREPAKLSGFDAARLMTFFCDNHGANGLILAQSSQKHTLDGNYVKNFMQIIKCMKRWGGISNAELVSQLLYNCFLYRESEITSAHDAISKSAAFLEHIDWVEALPIFVSETQYLNTSLTSCESKISSDLFQYVLNSFQKLATVKFLSLDTDRFFVKSFIKLCENIIESLKKINTFKDKQKCYLLITQLSKVICNNTQVLKSYIATNQTAKAPLMAICIYAQVAPDIYNAVCDDFSDTVSDDSTDEKITESKSIEPLADALTQMLDLKPPEYLHMMAAHHITILTDAIEADYKRVHEQKIGVRRNYRLQRLFDREVKNIPVITRDIKTFGSVNANFAQDERSRLRFAPLLLLLDLVREGADGKAIENCLDTFGNPSKPSFVDFYYFYKNNPDCGLVKWNVAALKALIITVPAKFFTTLQDNPLLLDFFGINQLAKVLTEIQHDERVTISTKRLIDQYCTSSIDGDLKISVERGVLEQNLIYGFQEKCYAHLYAYDAEILKEKKAAATELLRIKTRNFDEQIEKYIKANNKNGAWELLQKEMKLWENAESTQLGNLFIDEMIAFFIKVLTYQRSISGNEKTSALNKLIAQFSDHPYQAFTSTKNSLSSDDQKILERGLINRRVHKTIYFLSELWPRLVINAKKHDAEKQLKLEKEYVEFLQKRAIRQTGSFVAHTPHLSAAVVSSAPQSLSLSQKQMPVLSGSVVPVASIALPCAAEVHRQPEPDSVEKSAECEALAKIIVELRVKYKNQRDGVFALAYAKFKTCNDEAPVLKKLHNQTCCEIKEAEAVCSRFKASMDGLTKIYSELKIFDPIKNKPVQAMLYNTQHQIIALQNIITEKMRQVQLLLKTENEVMLQLQSYIKNDRYSQNEGFSCSIAANALGRDIENISDNFGLTSDTVMQERKKAALALGGRLDSLETESKATISSLLSLSATILRLKAEEQSLSAEINAMQKEYLALERSAKAQLKELPREFEKDLQRSVLEASASEVMMFFNSRDFCDDQNKIVLAELVFRRICGKKNDVSFLRGFNLYDLLCVFQHLPPERKSQTAIDLLRLFKNNGVKLNDSQINTLEQCIPTEFLLAHFRNTLHLIDTKSTPEAKDNLALQQESRFCATMLLKRCLPIHANDKVFEALFSYCTAPAEDIGYVDQKTARYLLLHNGAATNFSYTTLNILWKRANLGAINTERPIWSYTIGNEEDKLALWDSFNSVRKVLCLQVADASSPAVSSGGKLFGCIRVPHNECVATCLSILCADGIDVQRKKDAVTSLLSHEFNDSKDAKKYKKNKVSADLCQRLTLSILKTPERLINLCQKIMQNIPSASASVISEREALRKAYMATERKAALQEIALLAQYLDCPTFYAAMEDAVDRSYLVRNKNALRIMQALAKVYTQIDTDDCAYDSVWHIFLYCRNMAVYCDAYDTSKNQNVFVLLDKLRSESKLLSLWKDTKGIESKEQEEKISESKKPKTAVINASSTSTILHAVIAPAPAQATLPPIPIQSPQRLTSNKRTPNSSSKADDFHLKVERPIQIRIDALKANGAVLPKDLNERNFDMKAHSFSRAQKKLFGLQVLLRELHSDYQKNMPLAILLNLVDNARIKYELDATSSFNPCQSNTTKMLDEIVLNISGLPASRPTPEPLLWQHPIT
ncbi:MAG: hypothetical protein M1561_02205 [Gammaproteobacteria bacterium]|nr:hypothetical protein [Gammaproteobacteria bacterium]